MFGTPRFTAGEQPLTTVNTARLRSILAFLVLHANAPQSRERLAYLIWPDSAEAQARTNLRQLIHHLRRALPPDCTQLAVDNQTVCWTPNPADSVDVFEFENALERAQTARNSGDAATELAALETAAGLYHDDLLPDVYDDWLNDIRTRLRARFEEAVERLGTLCEEKGDRASAIAYAARLVALDPLREAAYYRLMLLHLGNGDRASAARVYHQCARNLKRELGIDPGPEIRELLERAGAMRRTPATAAAVSSAPQPQKLVGRTQEWHDLLDAWQLAGAGRAHVAIILGEPGIGKSRLADELFDACARDAGAATARTRCYVTQSGLAYTPVTDWLRADSFRNVRAVLSKSQLTELSRVLPEILAEHTEIDPPQPLTESWQRRHLYDALNAAVASVPKPLLLLVDDLQWCDRDSLEWMHVLLRSGAAQGTLLLATARPEEMGREHPATVVLRELRRTGQLTEVPLLPLGVSETAALAGQLASRNYEPAFTDDLYEATRGNPLFIVESVRMALEGRKADGRTPSHVQAVIASRLAQLSAQSYELAGLIAAIGRPASYELLTQTTDWDDASLSGALEELWQRRIIDVKNVSAHDYTHDLLRDVAYGELNPIRKRALHRRVAAALESMHAADEAPAGEIAAHYEAAGMPERAISWYGAAASNARRRFADAEGVEAIHRALVLCRALPETAKRDATEIELLARLGSSLVATQGYSMPEVGETYDRGLALCRETGNREHVFSMLSGSWVFRVVRGELREALDVANLYVENARAHREPALEMSGEFVSGATHFHLGNFAAANERLESSLALYRSNASHPALALFAGPDVGVFCRSYLPHVRWHLGDAAGAMAKSDEAVALAREVAHPFSLAIALSYAAMLAVFARQAGVALERAEQARSISEKHGIEYYRAVAQIVGGWANAVLGTVEPGIVALRQGLESFKAMQAQLRLPFYYGLLAEACGVAGRRDEALANLATGLAFANKNEEVWPIAELQRIHHDLQRA